MSVHQENPDQREDGDDDGQPPSSRRSPPSTAGTAQRKKILLRLDPAVHDALARWSSDEMRSTNAQIEFLLRTALREAGRLPSHVSRLRRPGRPSRADGATADDREG